MTRDQESSKSIESLPLAERPRERCLETGASCLSLRECIGLILGSGPPGVGCLGLAQKILNRPGQGLSSSDQETAFFTAMETTGLAYLKEIQGLGPANQAKLLAAFEIGRRYSLFRNLRTHKPKSKQSSPLAYQALQKITPHLRCNPQEWLGFVPIYRSETLGDLCLVERGTRTHVNVDPAEFFARVLALRPSGLFLFHNHPSGHLQPSPQDRDLTRRVFEISREFGIRLMGHWIVSSQDEFWLAADN